MKKTILGVFAAASMLMASCSTDVKDSTQVLTYPVFNMVTDLDKGESIDGSTEKTKVMMGAYTLFFNLTQGYASASTAVNYPISFDDVKYTFSTDTVKYVGSFIDSPDGRAYTIDIKNLSGYVNNDKALPLKNVRCELVPFNYPTNGRLPNIPTVPDVAITPQGLLMDYKIGDRFSVKTFMPDAIYTGKTRTTYTTQSGESKSFEAPESMFYRVILDMKKNTAMIVFYNAKFAEEMPMTLNIVLDELPITWNQGTYTISAKNVVPKVPDGNKLTENKGFIFDEFNFQFTDSRLTDALITYVVAGGKYKGNFKGSSLIYVKTENKN